MRAFPLWCRLGAVLALLVVSRPGFAQGCDLGVVIELIPCYKDSQGHITDTEDQTCQAGGAGAGRCVFCSESAEHCSDTDVSYTIATLSHDEHCPGCGTGTCCQNPTMCSYSGGG